MNFKEKAEILETAKKFYRDLHKRPEIGFDLPFTTGYVKDRLKEFGIDFTEKYGKSSVVAEIGHGDETIAFRADMDALPVEEKSGLPFSSEIKGCMHACGHDSHIAILLAVAGYLKKHESELNRKIMFIFQPSEECAVSGAKMMVDNGVTDGVSEIIATHCQPKLPSGEIGLCKGGFCAACVPLKLTFIGKSAHATMPENGIDAIAMANRVYTVMSERVNELADGRRYIWSVGRFSGGTAHNVICDKCEMDISFRYYDYSFAEEVEKELRAVCDQTVEKYGGKYILDWHISTGAVINDSEIIDKISEIAVNNSIITKELSPVMSSEDFGWYLTRVRGVLFHYGIKNEEIGSGASWHTDRFKIDEDAMIYPIKIFINYALN